MSSKVTNDFKAAFALLLTIMKVNYTTTTALNYSQTVFEWTLAGLITEGKIRYVWSEKYDPKREESKDNIAYWLEDVDGGNRYSMPFNHSKKLYLDAMEKVRIQATGGRKEWAQSEILNRCFEINQLIFPIALSEGLLDLKDIAAGIGAGAAGVPSERDH